MDDLGFGIAIGKHNRADAAQAASLGLVGALGAQMATMQEMRDRIATLELALAVEKAYAEGLTAFVDAFKAANPDSSVLRDTGRRFEKSGGVKTAGRMHYETAFDASLAARQIFNPKEYRTD